MFGCGKEKAGRGREEEVGRKGERRRAGWKGREGNGRERGAGAEQELLLTAFPSWRNRGMAAIFKTSFSCAAIDLLRLDFANFPRQGSLEVQHSAGVS